MLILNINIAIIIYLICLNVYYLFTNFLTEMLLLDISLGYIQNELFIWAITLKFQHTICVVRKQGLRRQIFAFIENSKHATRNYFVSLTFRSDELISFYLLTFHFNP